MNSYSPEDLERVYNNVMGDLHEFNGSLRTIGYDFLKNGIDWDLVEHLSVRRVMAVKAAETFGLNIDSPERVV